MGLEWFILIVPIVLSLLARIVWRHKVALWEMFIPIVITLICILVMKGVMIGNKTSDIEYFSEYPTEVRYYEKWDEYVHRTCYRSYKCGKSTCTQAYDCSYVDRHSVDYKMYMNTGNVYNISLSTYNHYKALWANSSFVDMHRDYHSYDGDMYKSTHDGKFEHIEPYSYSRTYENKTQTSETLFKFRKLDSLELKKVYEYPKIADGHQKACIGCSNEEDYLLRQYNALIGSRFEVKMFILVYDGQDISASELQRIYWQGGNKNELIVCLDKNGDWVKTFSWCDDKRIEVEVNDIFMNKDLTLSQKISKMEHEVEILWKRKHFSDFDYIEIPLNKSDLLWIFFVSLLLSVGIIVWAVKNEIDCTMS